LPKDTADHYPFRYFVHKQNIANLSQDIHLQFYATWGTGKKCEIKNTMPQLSGEEARQRDRA